MKCSRYLCWVKCARCCLWWGLSLLVFDGLNVRGVIICDGLTVRGVVVVLEGLSV